MAPEAIGDRIAAIYGEIQATAMRGPPFVAATTASPSFFR